MKLVIIDKNNKARINKALDWVIHIIGYTASFLLISLLFDSFEIGGNNKLINALLAVVLVYILNRTVKPLLFHLTLPITGLTLGVSYFILNMFILKLVDIIMMDRLNFTSYLSLFLIAILLSVTNVVIELVIIKPIIRRFKRK